MLSPDFDGMYAQAGRPSTAPERLLRALLLRAFHSVRSERRLMEQLDCTLLFRWVEPRGSPVFVGLSVDAPVRDASAVSKSRGRFPDGAVAQRLLTAILDQPRLRALMPDGHFSVDGTPIQAWASRKSFRPKPPVTPDDEAGRLVPPPRPRPRPRQAAAARGGTGGGTSAATRPTRA